ncbi:TraB/GumN family protein [Erythrobacter gaetbuli]|uniref:TraB/GumN family protein n=1 Tax=Qipengyuania gaetbuli TaxID=266952 RepID=A0A844Y0E2_9SPHN|nr:TraB/GumN family protein [Qipengyuania gaetbuli]MXO50582.1 TraB/GumN family protein [Qipengyuania gaetbuli]
MSTRHFVLTLMLLLAACQQEPQDVAEAGEAYPALWEITDETGALEGWLFGTVHALPEDLDWRSDRFDRIEEDADLLVVEVSGLDDRSALEAQFQALATDRRHLPPVKDRLGPVERERLRNLLKRNDMAANALDGLETWAAALALAQFGRIHPAEYGADKVLLGDFASREIFELEGAGPQLAIFDGLPEEDQRDLLVSVLEEVDRAPSERPDLALIWSRGDLDRLEEITGEGMLADPELREVLLVERNRTWAAQIENLLTAAPRPLIAVGAGHLLGPDGMPALLEARGYSVRRIQ